MSRNHFDIDDHTVYEQLQGYLKSGTLVLCAGSGLSAQACTEKGERPPTWKKLLEEMILWCKRRRLLNSDNDAAEIQELIDANYLIDAGQELKEVLRNDTLLQECIGELCLCNTAKMGDAHELIANIRFRAFLTTNYDCLIEGSHFKYNGTFIDKFYENTGSSALNAFNARKQFVFKLHGDIENPELIVIGQESYDRVLEEIPQYRQWLTTLFATSSVLYIGYGGQDPNIEGISRAVARMSIGSRRHWMLVPEDTFPIRKVKRLGDDRGINVVYYPVDDEHTGVVRFLQRLAAPP